MPRKKKIAEDIPTKLNEREPPLPVDKQTGKVINFYEKIPKHFIDKVENLNFNIHKLKIPMRVCVVAPSGSGKTNFLVNLIEMFSRGEGTFQTIHIITRNKDEPLYRWIQTLSDAIIVKEGLSSTPQLDKFDREYNHLVVFDDLVLSKDLTKVQEYYIRARKMNVSVIFLSQSFFRIPKIIRNNCNYMVLLKLSGNREVNIILSEFGLGVTKEELIKIYEYATAEKMSPLVIDLEAPPSERFRKGIIEIIDWHKLIENDETKESA
jgi:ABC-type dipeptide/oligopeptide/nickel transport system ATPase component